MLKRNHYFSIILFLIFSLILSTSLFAVDKRPVGFGDKHFVGGRFGAWTMTTSEDFIDSLTDFSSSALYLEFFYDYRFTPFLAAEFSIGIFSQGDLEYDTNAGILTGAAKLYPVFLSAKLYPFSKYKDFSFWPYLKVGGGLVYGNRDFTSTYSGDPINYYVEESQTKFTYNWGFGIDWPIADQIGFNIDFKNTPVKFGDALAGLKDFSGWSLTVGVGYIMKSK